MRHPLETLPWKPSPGPVWGRRFGLALARVTIRVIESRRYLLLSLALAACGMDQSAPGDGGVGPGLDVLPGPDLGAFAPDAAGPPARCLSYSPAAYFYEVTLGRTELLRFTVRNTCRGPRRILAARIVGGDGAFALDPLPLPMTLEFEEVLRIPVRFSPLEPRGYEAQVALELEDPEQPEFRVRVLGEGAGGELRAMPSSLDLDGAPVGCRTASRAVALWNEGPGPMYVYSIALEGPDAEAFSFRHDRPLPRDVAAYDGIRVALSFRPKRTGEHEASLLVTYNGKESPARVSLRADAVGERRREERFSLPDPPAHDLVFLVPPASSARGQAEALLEFLRAVSSERLVDLRLLVMPSGARDAVLGTPVACPGFPAPVDVSRVEPALLEVLVPCMLSVGRSELEPRSAAVLVAAMERSFVAAPPEPTLRPDAVTHVVFTAVHDHWRAPIGFVLDFLAAVPAQHPPAFFVHGYEQPAPGQTSPFGPRHHLIVEATDGLFVDQRSTAWSSLFERLYAKMKEGPRPLVPKLPPDWDTLTVFDQTRSATVSYGLDGQARRVWVPAGLGSELSLSYDAACGL